jgi:hypothetical protein
MEATMRWAHFVEGLFFMVGFLVVCLVVMTSRPYQLVPARKTVLANPRSRQTGRLSNL